MIFLDANLFVELIGRVGGGQPERVQRAESLMDAVAAGTLKATTSEAVIVETVQVLESAFGSAFVPAQAALSFGALINARGLRLSPKHIYLRALDNWAARPGLGFVDALTIAYVEQGASCSRRSTGSCSSRRV